MKRQVSIDRFVSEIWKWFGVHKRDLPWRDLHHLSADERAYRVLVSEVMLQQTQVTRVIVIYKRFLDEFPVLSDLAKASNREMILAWRGMGYNSRALRLRDAAKEIVERSEKNPNFEIRNPKVFFPREMKDLMSLSGVGHYTAAALRNFAFNLPTPCIETNIRRVLHTKFVGPPNEDGTFKKDDQYLLKLAEEVLEVALRTCPGWVASRKSASRQDSGQLVTCDMRLATADWHAALMDYGSLALPKVRPKNAVKKKEPGRLVGSRYIPNRIFRGRVVEELRNEPKGLGSSEIGKRVCIDWKSSEHSKWFQSILSALESDTLIEKKGRRYVLAV